MKECTTTSPGYAAAIKAAKDTRLPGHSALGGPPEGMFLDFIHTKSGATVYQVTALANGDAALWHGESVVAYVDSTGRVYISRFHPALRDGRSRSVLIRRLSWFLGATEGDVERGLGGEYRLIDMTEEGREAFTFETHRKLRARLGEGCGNERKAA